LALSRGKTPDGKLRGRKFQVSQPDSAITSNSGTNESDFLAAFLAVGV
jgi:hypothetical protein